MKSGKRETLSRATNCDVDVKSRRARVVTVSIGGRLQLTVVLTAMDEYAVWLGRDREDDREDSIKTTRNNPGRITAYPIVIRWRGSSLCDLALRELQFSPDEGYPTLNVTGRKIDCSSQPLGTSKGAISIMRHRSPGSPIR